MIEKEAKQIIKEELSLKATYVFSSKFVEASRVAIKALGKQIPKEPKTERTFIGKAFCPDCNKMLKDSQRYCDRCGQKILNKGITI